jgi:hypothetical protein
MSESKVCDKRSFLKAANTARLTSLVKWRKPMDRKDGDFSSFFNLEFQWLHQAVYDYN